ncbi:MAG: DegT/DnrJ/EryC1/StrS family aminotransferase, partial [Myxococcota bacterium]
MRARMRLDIGWSDLASGLAACFASGAPARRAYEIENRWSEDDDALACLSVRSGLDLYLAAAELPPGSEVLVSALTIPDVPRILEQRGLVPVPVDLDPSMLAPGIVELENARTPRTRALLLAHLFGERLAVEPFAAFARERGLELWEDCAQTYSGDGYRGHDAAALALFSFGTIKTATGLGG